MIYGNGAANIHALSTAAKTTSCGAAAAMTSSRPADEYAELRGGAGDDHLSGTLATYNPFRPGGAMHGGPGNDLIETYNSDTITGAAGDDHIRILDGGPTVHPGAGDDLVDEVDGVAHVSYWNAPGPIEVDLATGLATGWGVDQLVGSDERPRQPLRRCNAWRTGRRQPPWLLAATTCSKPPIKTTHNT